LSAIKICQRVNYHRILPACHRSPDTIRYMIRYLYKVNVCDSCKFSDIYHILNSSRAPSVQFLFIRRVGWVARVRERVYKMWRRALYILYHIIEFYNNASARVIEVGGWASEDDDGWSAPGQEINEILIAFNASGPCREV